ncbi:endonuclease III [Fannyhessea vaginae]|uniref:endonuclease III n=1 Tax=Fannyhessea vaginae TaxID=82135 RepID=UPI003A7F7532
MAQESQRSKQKRACAFYEILHARYHGAKSALTYHDPFTLTICVMLSAQTTDAAVNKVTPQLFARWPDAKHMAQAKPEDIGEVIRTIGFWRAKAKHCVGASQMIMSDFAGEVPQTMEELMRLPGVGRKTANIVLNKAFNKTQGIAVDTHVFRISTRLQFTRAKTPLEAEQDLLKLLPPTLWSSVNEEWIHFGREICKAKNPCCETCIARALCPSYAKFSKK